VFRSIDLQICAIHAMCRIYLVSERVAADGQFSHAAKRVNDIYSGLCLYLGLFRIYKRDWNF
jgi:hypothetical protein